MRKLLTIVVICATIAFLSACTNNIEQEVKPTETPSETSLPNESTAPTVGSSDLLKYQSKDGWSIQYPASWDKVTDSTLQESATEKYISFRTNAIPEEGIEKWLDSKIEKTLSFEEAENKLLEDITTETKGEFKVYKYAIQSTYVRPTNISEIRNIIYVGNEHIYEFHGPLTKVEFENIVETFTFEESSLTQNHFDPIQLIELGIILSSTETKPKIKLDDAIKNTDQKGKLFVTEYHAVTWKQHGLNQTPAYIISFKSNFTPGPNDADNEVCFVVDATTGEVVGGFAYMDKLDPSNKKIKNQEVNQDS